MMNKSSLARSARLRLMLLASLLAALVAQPAQATIMQLLEVEDLTRRSSDVIVGQVQASETEWNDAHTRIYTRIQVRVDETLKGSLTRSQIITVTQLGGEKDGVRLDFAGRPTFTDGESVVLFTTRGKNNDLIVVGLKQGKMTIAGNEVKRDFSGITLVQRSADGRSLQPLTARPARMTLAELRNRVANTR
jgi:hypothetical protein